MQNGINIGFKLVDILDYNSIHCEVIRNNIMSSNILTLYIIVYLNTYNYTDSKDSTTYMRHL